MMEWKYIYTHNNNLSQNIISQMTSDIESTHKTDSIVQRTKRVGKTYSQANNFLHLN